MHSIEGISNALISAERAIIYRFTVAQMVESACNAGEPGSIPESGRSLGEGNGKPLQYSCLGNPWTEEPGGLQSIASQKSWTGLSD